MNIPSVSSFVDVAVVVVEVVTVVVVEVVIVVVVVEHDGKFIWD